MLEMILNVMFIIFVGHHYLLFVSHLGNGRISHLTQFMKLQICLSTFLVLLTVCVFGFWIKTAVHLAVDGIFSLCFAVGVWRSELNG